MGEPWLYTSEVRFVGRRNEDGEKFALYLCAIVSSSDELAPRVQSVISAFQLVALGKPVIRIIDKGVPLSDPRILRVVADAEKSGVGHIVFQVLPDS